MKHIVYQSIRIADRLYEKLSLSREEFYIADIGKAYPHMSDNITITHTHDFYYLAWIEKGRFNYYVDTERYFVPDDSILMLPPGKMHRFESVSGLSGFAIHFSEAYFRSMHSQWANYFKYEIIKAFPILHVSDELTAKKIKDLVENINNTYHLERNTISSTASLFSYLTLLLCTLEDTQEFKDAKHNSPSVGQPCKLLYLEFVNLLEQNFRNNHSVRFYADKLGIGLNALNKCCKANGAKTTVVVIRSRLIEEAKRLLLFTDMRSSEISAELGFSEQAHFVNFFRRYMNVSPKEYRCGKRAIFG